MRLATSRPRSLFVGRKRGSWKLLACRQRTEYSSNFSILNGTLLSWRRLAVVVHEFEGGRIKIMRISKADISVNFFNLKFRAVQVLPLQREKHDKWSLLFFFFFFFLKLNFTQLYPRMRKVFNILFPSFHQYRNFESRSNRDGVKLYAFNSKP